MVSCWLAVCLSMCLSVCLPIRPSICRTSVFLFPDDIFSKCQWILTKLGMFIDIVEIWFQIANRQIS